MFRNVALLTSCLFLLVPSVATAVEVGDTVLAYWQPADAYFVGTVVEDRGDSFFIVFEDSENAVVDKAKIRANDIKVGTTVLARWEDGSHYPGTVAKVVGRALYIHYDDGDKGWVSWSGIAVR